IGKKISASIKKIKRLFEKDPYITNLVTICMSEIASAIQDEDLYVFSRKYMEQRSKGVKTSKSLSSDEIRPNSPVTWINSPTSSSTGCSTERLAENSWYISSAS